MTAADTARLAAHPPEPERMDALILAGFHQVLAALDTDRDGRVSASELAGAAGSLRALDRNRDGWVSREELLPAVLGAGCGIASACG